MSLFGSLMGDFDDDLGIMRRTGMPTKRKKLRKNPSESENQLMNPFEGMDNHMNAMNMQMRSMNRLMNSFMPDPFNMLQPFDGGFQQNALMERGQPNAMGALFPAFPPMPNMNRLISADIGAPPGASFCSSSVISMSSGPDGRPLYYQATTSTKTGPGGVRETRKTVQDSRSGIKKMAIGHHIGDRAHIIEKEQDLRSGQLEERQEFINLDEEEAELFDREFTNRAGGSGQMRRQQRAIRAAPNTNNATSTLTIEPVDDSDDEAEEAAAERPRNSHHYMPALPAPPTASGATLPTPSLSSQQHHNRNTTATSASPSSPRSATTTRQRGSSTMSSGGGANDTNNVQVNGVNGVNNNNNYLMTNGTTPRRAYHYRSHLASPRRPLRTPSSSPLTLTTTPAIPSASSIATGSSQQHHHHPYNNAAALRRQQRAKQSQQQQDFHIQGLEVPTEVQQTSSKYNNTSSGGGGGSGASTTSRKSRH